MKVIIEGQLISVYKNTDYKDKETGEVSVGKHKLQLLVEEKLSNGSVKHDMQAITIPDSLVDNYQDQIGQHVQVKCDIASKGHVSFYVK